MASGFKVQDRVYLAGEAVSCRVVALCRVDNTALIGGAHFQTKWVSQELLTLAPDEEQCPDNRRQPNKGAEYVQETCTRRQMDNRRQVLYDKRG